MDKGKPKKELMMQWLRQNERVSRSYRHGIAKDAQKGGPRHVAAINGRNTLEMGNKNAPKREWYAQFRTAACDLVRLNLIGVDCMSELRPLNGVSDLD